MSWGIRITLLYLGFVAMIVTMVILTTRENIDLEYKDYYKRELNYQDKIDAITNEQALAQSLEHQVLDGSIVIKAPANFLTNGIRGELHFYCPAEAAKDLVLPMEFDAKGELVINRNQLSKGMYKLRMSWNIHDKSFFKEVVINL